MNAVVNVAKTIPMRFTNASGVAKTGLTVTGSARLAGSATTQAATVIERTGGDYDAAIAFPSVGTWFFTGTTTIDGFPGLWTETVDVDTAAKDDPAASITTLYGAELANLDAAVSTRATPANITALQAAIAAGSVTLVSPLSVDGGRLTLVQGDSYAAAQSRQLSWSLTGQPDLTTAVVTLTIVSGTTLAKTSATVTNPASGSPTIAFVLTAAETAAFTPAKVGTFDLSATIGSDEITLARGRVFVEEDV
jgi:hypothetical protein